MKVVKSFPEVELYWLLNGKGSFPKSSNEKKTVETPKHSASSGKAIPEKSIIPSGDPTKKIEKIVIFYSDGTFDAFEN